MDTSFQDFSATASRDDSDDGAAAHQEGDSSSALLGPVDNDYYSDDGSLSIFHQESGLTQEDSVEEQPAQQQQQQQQHSEHGNYEGSNSSQSPSAVDDVSSIEEMIASTPTRRRRLPSSLSDHGPLSPFSPHLRRGTNQSSTLSTQQRPPSISWQPQSPSSSSNPDLSLLPCRRVSVVVRVKPFDRCSGSRDFHAQQEEEEDTSKLCLFPLLPEPMSSSSSSLNDDAMTNVVLTPVSETLKSIAGMETQDLVAVNPMAFGKYIPAQVTMDTARLVANVANIESEDWARRFRFDQVLWPRLEEKRDSELEVNHHRQQEDSALLKLAKSMGNDAIYRQKGSLCLGIGGSNSGKMECMFGYDRSNGGGMYNFGLLEMVVETVLSNLPEHAVCTLSLLEIVDEQILVDMSLETNESNSVHIRHVDNKGAIVQGLSDVPLDSMTGLGHLMRKAYESNPKDNSRGHVIASLKVWQNGVQLDLQNHAKCTSIVLADLASGEEGDGTNTRRMASFRKSLSGLRGVLRSLLQQEQDGLAANAASYRECTLTKVLQRPLSDCQTVVLACVSASADSYERSLHTLNYINRLLIRPGMTARSPFQQTPAKELTERDRAGSPTRTSLFDQYGDSEALLKSVLSDPRQRLAKLMPPRSPPTPAKLELTDLADEGYEPYDYMQIDPGAIIQETDPPASPIREKLDDACRGTVEESEEHCDDFSEGNVDTRASAMERDEFVPGSSADVLDRTWNDGDNGVRDDMRIAPSSIGKRFSGDAKKTVVSGLESMQFKAVVQLSEESSTQPTESMTSSARTGHRALHSPDDVNGWIASFEAKQDDASEAEHGVSYHEADRVTDGRPPVEELRESSDAAFVSQSPDWSRNVDANTTNDSAHHIEDVPSDDAAGTAFKRDWDGVFGISEAQDESGAGSGYDSRAENASSPKPSPSIERRNVFSTPKACWPELDDDDDDQSALSLSSLQKTVGSETEGTARSEQSLYNAKIGSGRFRPTSSHEHATTEKLDGSINEETPKHTYSEIKPPTGLSPTEQCIGEIHVLEDVVEQIEKLHNGIWETSASSLDRLRSAQKLQKHAIEEAVAARKKAEAECQRLKEVLARESNEREMVAREWEERLAVMEERIEKALIDRDDMEAIAEEAIAAQDKLEKKVTSSQAELDSQRAVSEDAVTKYNNERKSHDTVARRLESTMSSLNEMRAAHGDSKNVIAELEATIDTLRLEIEGLTEERDASQALSSDQSRIIEEQNRLKRQFEHCQKEIASLHDENERLTSNLRDYKVRFKNAEEQQKAFRIQFESENLALQSDIDELQRRCLEAEDAGERASQEYEEERLVLLNEVSGLKEQLDDAEAQISAFRQADEGSTKQRDEEIDNLASELHELQLEREQYRQALTTVESKYEKLRADAKEKLKQLVKERKAATKTIQRLQDENAAQSESSCQLQSSFDQSERERELLQNRMNGLMEQLEVEQVARQEAEGRIQQLESRRSTDTLMDLDETSSRSSLHLDHFTEAEQALRKEIEAEKSGTGRRSVSFERHHSPYRTEPVVGSREAREVHEQRALFAQNKKDMDTRYGSEGSEREMVSFDAFRAEQSRRLLAEDLAASMASRSKDVLEKRNKEIMNLKLELCAVSDEKESEILRLRSQVHSLKRNSLSK